MSKDHAQRFVSLLEQDELLKEQIFQSTGQLAAKMPEDSDLRKLFNEVIAPGALAVGLEFTLEELQAAYGGVLADSELAGVVGGLNDQYGNFLTTVGYGCDKWVRRNAQTWHGAVGTCGSCYLWDEPTFMGGAMMYFGEPGICRARR